jgi:hypothetical protein
MSKSFQGFLVPGHLRPESFQSNFDAEFEIFDPVDIPDTPASKKFNNAIPVRDILSGDKCLTTRDRRHHFLAIPRILYRFSA